MLLMMIALLGKTLSLWFLFQFTLYSVRATLLWATGGAAGIFMAVAIPLSIPHRKIFVSFNFAANYAQPRSFQWPPAGVTRETLLDELITDVLLGRNCNNCSYTQEESNKQNRTEFEKRFISEARAAKERIKYSLLSRTNFYEILKFKFEESGLQGESCLLRLICETNSSHLGQINGVLGNLVHIMFTPSSSQYEALPAKYYNAEALGKRDKCAPYQESCKQSILDLMSSKWQDVVVKFTSNKI